MHNKLQNYLTKKTLMLHNKSAKTVKHEQSFMSQWKYLHAQQNIGAQHKYKIKNILIVARFPYVLLLLCIAQSCGK